MPAPTDTNKETLKALNKIESHLSRINKNDESLRSVEQERLAIEKDKDKREFKDRLVDKITRKVESKSDEKILKSLDKLKPAGLETVTSKGFFDIFVDAFRFSKIDELEPLLRAIDKSDDRIYTESAFTNVLLEQIFKKLVDQDFDTEQSFKQIRAAEEGLRIQEERNKLIGEQTEVIESLGKGEKEKPLKKKGILANILGWFSGLFGGITLGNIGSFVAGIPAIGLLSAFITGVGGLLGLLATGILWSLSSAGAFIIGFNIGTVISNWIDKKMGLGKGSLGVWLHDAINSERGLFGSLKEALFNWLGVDTWTQLKVKFETKFKNSMKVIGNEIKEALKSMNLWEAATLPFRSIQEFYTGIQKDRSIKKLQKHKRPKDPKGFMTWLLGRPGSLLFDVVEGNLGKTLFKLKEGMGKGKLKTSGKSFEETLFGYNLKAQADYIRGISRSAKDLEQSRRHLDEKFGLMESQGADITEFIKRESLKAKTARPVPPPQNNVVVDNSRNTTVVPNLNLETETTDIILKRLQIEMAF
jgi:hypothetical protein